MPSTPLQSHLVQEMWAVRSSSRTPSLVRWLEGTRASYEIKRLETLPQYVVIMFGNLTRLNLELGCQTPFQKDSGCNHLIVSGILLRVKNVCQSLPFSVPLAKLQHVSFLFSHSD